jgi:DNA-binding MarR family transcriptional regulator
MDLDRGDVLVLDAETRALEHPPGDVAARENALRLWLRLLTCSNLIEGEIRRRLRDRFDVTLPRFDLMAQLEKAPEGMTLGDLSRRMMVSNGNITGLVERLAELGLVARTPHPTDRRAAFVSLTAEGRAAFAKMADAHASWIAELLSDFSACETRETMRLLAGIKQSVRRGIDGCEEPNDD